MANFDKRASLVPRLYRLGECFGDNGSLKRLREVVKLHESEVLIYYISFKYAINSCLQFTFWES